MITLEKMTRATQGELINAIKLDTIFTADRPVTLKAKKQLEETRRMKGNAIKTAGVSALTRLLPYATEMSAQSESVAGFLLGIYNGRRFRHNLNDLCRLELNLFNDCIAVLELAHGSARPIDEYFHGGQVFFEDLAILWQESGFGASAEQHYTYELTPRADWLGGGWQLSLLKGGEEKRCGVFPASDEDGYGTALQMAEDWTQRGKSDESTVTR